MAKGKNDNSGSTVPLTVLPGDDLTQQILPPLETSSVQATKKRKPIPKLGIGLAYDNHSHSVACTMAGSLIYARASNTFYVRSNSCRYIPQLEDRVVAVVQQDRIGGGDYLMHIGGPHPAILSSLAFQGATKRNKPQLSAGTLLYCRVSSVDTDMDPQVSCINGPNDEGAARKDWMTKEALYGELKGGTTRKISLGLARELLHPQNVVLHELSLQKSLNFEICVGVNGVLWVNSRRLEQTIMIINAIANSEVLDERQVRGMVKAMADTVQRNIAEDEENDGGEDDDSQ